MLILATESPTKRMIMDRSGLAYEAISANIDERAIEKSHPELDARETAILLARSKAEALASLYPDDCIVAADTFGVLPDGSRLHKAKTATEKMKMCLSQSGKTTTIYTGVCVINRGKAFTSSTATKITYMKFDEAMINNAHKYNPNRRNAALGFHVDSAGFALIEKIEGSYMGALGLPLDKMYNLLKRQAMTIAEIKNKLTSLGVSSTEPIIVGSGILDMLGIRPSNDIDLLISKETFYKIAGHGHEILQRPDGSEKIEVDDTELMYDWYGKKVSDAAIKTTVIDGIKFMSIEEVRRWKALLDRSKDQADILLIDKYLESCGKA